MKFTATLGATLCLMGSTALAGGLDRSGQSIAPLFAADRTLTFSHVKVTPSVTGSDSLGADYDVGEDYSMTTAAWTHDLNDRMRYMVMLDQPYGADVDYDVNPTTSMLGGTGADLNSWSLTLAGKYMLNENLGVIGGVSAERIDATVDLNGLAYGTAFGVRAGVPGPGLATFANSFAALGGYSFEMEQTTSVGAFVGASYEIPDIALRVVGIYRFENEFTADTRESSERLGWDNVAGTVDFVTPRSFTLEAQTGIAADTLLTFGYRWAEFSSVDIVPDQLDSDLVNLNDHRTYSIGLGRRFSDSVSGSITYTYEAEEDDDQVSPLGPTNGRKALAIGARFTGDMMTVSAGISYTKLGDAKAEVGDNAVAEFEDSSAFAIGFRAEYTF